MITNVIYKGDRLIQKGPHINYLTKKPDLTREYNQIYVKGAHEAIVSEELWNRCQEETKIRAKTHSWMIPEEKPPVRIRRSSHPLYGKLYCAECGSPMERVTAGRKGKEKKMWRCKRNNGECHSHYIDESKIVEAIGELNLLLVKKINIGHDGEMDIVMVKRYERIYTGEITVSFVPISEGSSPYTLHA